MVASNGGIHEIPLPKPLENRLQEAGFLRPNLHVSEVAICLAVAIAKTFAFGSQDSEAFRALRQAALSLRHAGLQVGLDLPVLVVLALERNKEYHSFRPVFDRWAADQDWHRGDFALHLSPPVDPAGEAGAGWQGPKSREEMVLRLLGPGTQDWDLTPLERPTEEGAAKQLETWAQERDPDRTDPHGDLVRSVAEALRNLVQARSKGRGGEAEREAEEAAGRSVDAWVARHLRAAGETAGAREETP